MVDALSLLKFDVSVTTKNNTAEMAIYREIIFLESFMIDNIELYIIHHKVIIYNTNWNLGSDAPRVLCKYCLTVYK